MATADGTMAHLRPSRSDRRLAGSTPKKATTAIPANTNPAPHGRLYALGEFPR